MSLFFLCGVLAGAGFGTFCLLSAGRAFREYVRARPVADFERRRHGALLSYVRPGGQRKFWVIPRPRISFQVVDDLSGELVAELDDEAQAHALRAELEAACAVPFQNQKART